MTTEKKTKRDPRDAFGKTEMASATPEAVLGDADTTGVGRGGQEELQPSEASEKKGKPESEPNQATLLVGMLNEAGYTENKLFHSDGRAFIHRDGEAIPVEGQSFSDMATVLYFEKKGRAISLDAIRGAENHFAATARLKGERRPVFVRIGHHEGRVYLDLADRKPSHGIVEIDATGWRLMPSKNCPVAFHRPASMLPLPPPVKGGQMDEIRPLLNLGDDEDTEHRWAKLAAWTVGCFEPKNPLAILLVLGGRGSGKSDLAKFVRFMFDPDSQEVRSINKQTAPRDLAIAGSKNCVLSFDNITGISEDVSNLLCTMSTGGGYSTRAMSKDRDEAQFNLRCPVMLTAIAVRMNGDLQERTYSIEVPPISGVERKYRQDLDDAATKVRPRVLGGILSAVVEALKNRASVVIDDLPRMADAAKWAVAAEPALGVARGAVMRALTKERNEAGAKLLDASPLPGPIEALLTINEGAWEGTVAELLKALADRVPYATTRQQGWPPNPNQLSQAMSKLAPDLLGAGVLFEKGKHVKAGNLVRLSRVPVTDAGGLGEESVTGVRHPENASNSGGFAPGDAGDAERTHHAGARGPDGSRAGVQ